MHTEQALQFKSFVPPLVECLDHADGTIRERAKLSLIDLFRSVIGAIRPEIELTNVLQRYA